MYRITSFPWDFVLIGTMLGTLFHWRTIKQLKGTHHHYKTLMLPRENSDRAGNCMKNFPDLPFGKIHTISENGYGYAVFSVCTLSKFFFVFQNTCKLTCNCILRLGSTALCASSEVYHRNKASASWGGLYMLKLMIN